MLITSIGAGAEVIDQLTLEGGLTLPAQSIGAAVFSTGFDGVDGILGYVALCCSCVKLALTLSHSIGPQDLTCGMPDCRLMFDTFLRILARFVPSEQDKMRSYSHRHCMEQWSTGRVRRGDILRAITEPR